MNKTFDGESSDLKKTVIVPTLDSPVEKNQNVIWCSSFLAAWKELKDEIARGDIVLEGKPAAAALLNRADDPREHVPEGLLYVAVGWNQKGIIERIQKELKAAFPAKPAPTFPDITEDSFVAYSYLEANVKFKIPYFQNRKPLKFTDSKGQETNVASFGIRPEDDYAYYKLRSQPRILFQKGRIGEANYNDFEFAVDLCANSSPSQIIVARIKREPTLAAALERIANEEKIHQQRKKQDPDYVEYLESIGPNDVLLVPDLFWRISHRFKDMEGKDFLNANLKGQRLDVAQQDILFRLDRSGAEVKSESKMYCKPIATNFILDRPFFICMKKRGETMPYFVMWVDNAELLTPWTKDQ
ncbi:MAG: hypothetical protein JW849_03310 [Phycisphaerae bacterium]|nr:hypothetical protein [Phycisphaerae bacterium]